MKLKEHLMRYCDEALLSKLGLCYEKNDNDETNTRVKTDELNVSQVIRLDPRIWRGKEISRSKEKRKIIISDAEYLPFMVLWIKRERAHAKEANPLNETEKDLRARFSTNTCEYEFVFWDYLMSLGFEIYLWDKTRSCLRKPLHSFRDFFTRSKNGIPQYEISDAETIKLQLSQWGEVPQEYTLFDYYKKNVFFSNLFSLLKEKIPNFRSRSFEHDSVKLSDVYSLPASDYFSKIQMQVIKENPHGHFILDEQCLARGENFFSEVRNFHVMTRVLLKGEWPITRLSFFPHLKELSLDGNNIYSLSSQFKQLESLSLSESFYGEILDLSCFDRLQELFIFGGSKIKKIIFPQKGTLRRIDICGNNHLTHVENIHLQQHLEALSLGQCDVLFDGQYTISCPSSLVSLELVSFGSDKKLHQFDLSICHQLHTLKLKGGGIDRLQLSSFSSLKVLHLKTSAINQFIFEGDLFQVGLDEFKCTWNTPGFMGCSLNTRERFSQKFLFPLVALAKEARIESIFYVNLTSGNFPQTLEKMSWTHPGVVIPRLIWDGVSYKKIELSADEFSQGIDLSRCRALEEVTISSRSPLYVSKVSLPSTIQKIHFCSGSNVLGFYEAPFSQFKELKELTVEVTKSQQAENRSVTPLGNKLPDSLESLSLVSEMCFIPPLSELHHLKKVFISGDSIASESDSLVIPENVEELVIDSKEEGLPFEIDIRRCVKLKKLHLNLPHLKLIAMKENFKEMKDLALPGKIEKERAFLLFPTDLDTFPKLKKLKIWADAVAHQYCSIVALNIKELELSGVNVEVIHLNYPELTRLTICDSPGLKRIQFNPFSRIQKFRLKNVSQALIDNVEKEKGDWLDPRDSLRIFNQSVHASQKEAHAVPCVEVNERRFDHQIETPKKTRLERKFLRAGIPVGEDELRMARYKIMNAVGVNGGFYQESNAVLCVVKSVTEEGFQNQKQSCDYVFSSDRFDLSASRWNFFPSLHLFEEISLKKEILELCDVAYFPDRNQYGIKLKKGPDRNIEVEYLYQHRKVPFLEHHKVSSELKPPFIASELISELERYQSFLPIKESDGINEILNYCKKFSAKKELKKIGPEWIWTLLSQSGSCRHRALACLILCAYKKIPCRLVESEIHAYVEIYHSRNQKWEQYDFGGEFIDNIELYDHDALAPLHAGSTSVLQAPSLSLPNLPIITEERVEKPSFFTLLFTHEDTLHNKSTITDLIHTISAHPRTLLRFHHPEYAWKFNTCLLRYYLSHDNADPKKYLYIHDAEQMKSVFSEYRVDSQGKIVELKGPLNELIENGDLLVVNWTSFSANEAAIYKSILDTMPTLHGKKINKNLKIIGLEHETAMKEDDSFYSRWTTLLKTTAAIESEAKAETWYQTETAESFPEVRLYQDHKHWKAVLLGQLGAEGDKFNFKPGALAEAIINKKSGIIFYNPPLFDFEFNDFMQTLMLKKEILLNGQYYSLPENFKVIVKSEKLLTYSDVTLIPQEPVNEKVLEINSSNFSSLFSSNSIDDEGYVHSKPNGLFSEYDHFVISTPLSQSEEQQLLYHAKQFHKTMTVRSASKTEETSFSFVKESCLLFSNDPYFVAKTLSPSIPDCIVRHVDLKTTWEDLIEKLEIETFIPLKIKRSTSDIFTALISNKTVMLYGQMNLDLYQRLSTLLNKQHYLLVNGERIKPTGNLIFVSEKNQDPLYAQAVYQKNQPVSFEDYKNHLSRKYPLEAIDRLILIYQLAEKAKITLPCNLMCLETCLKQLTNANSLLEKEKTIKSVLLRSYSHKSEAYAFINVISKILFSSKETKPYSEKYKTKIKLSLEMIRNEPWQAANSLTGAQLRHCFHLDDSLEGINTLFDSTSGVLRLSEPMHAKLHAMLQEALLVKSEKEIISNKQRERVERFLRDEIVKVLILQGDPGIGKTHLVNQLFEENPMIEKCWGKEGILKWLAFSEGPPKLLVLDEFNLEDDAFWFFFSDLDKGYVCYEGKTYHLRPQDKIVCTCNADYEPQRKKQTTLPSQALTIYFKHPSDDVLLKLIEKDLQDTFSQIPHINEIKNIFLTAYHLVKNEFPDEVTLRDLHMLCHRFNYLKFKNEKTDNEIAIDACLTEFVGLYPSLEDQKRIKHLFFEKLNLRENQETPIEKKVLNTGYVLTSSRTFVWNLILEDIAIFQKGDFKSKNGILIEGPSGIGKTQIFIEALTHLHIPYDLISAGSKNVKEILRNAFHEGRAVILDELNLDPSLEKLLGQYLSGVDEEGNPPRKSGFFVLASQNPTCYAGRKRLSSPLLNRFHRCYLPDYSSEELIIIAEDKLKNHDHAVEFVNAFQQVKNDGIHDINTRNFFLELHTLQTYPVDEFIKQKIALEALRKIKTFQISEMLSSPTSDVLPEIAQLNEFERSLGDQDSTAKALINILYKLHELKKQEQKLRKRSELSTADALNDSINIVKNQIKETFKVQPDVAALKQFQRACDKALRKPLFSYSRNKKGDWQRVVRAAVNIILSLIGGIIIPLAIYAYRKHAFQDKTTAVTGLLSGKYSLFRTKTESKTIQTREAVSELINRRRI